MKKPLLFNILMFIIILLLHPSGILLIYPAKFNNQGHISRLYIVRPMSDKNACVQRLFKYSFRVCNLNNSQNLTAADVGY